MLKTILNQDMIPLLFIYWIYYHLARLQIHIFNTFYVIFYRLRRTFSDVKLNPLVNEKQLFKLNPYAAVEKNLARAIQAKGLVKKQEKVKRLAAKVIYLDTIF